MNLKKIAKYLDSKNELVVNEVVLSKAQKDNQIIHGSRAYNAQSPQHLRKSTTDWDILTKKPKKAAEEVAKTLKRRLGKDVNVVKGSHKGTYRVKIGKEVIADYTQIKTAPKTNKSWGNQYRSIKSIKRNATRLSNNPKLDYRKAKDLDTLSRIKKIERIDKLLRR